MTSPREQDSSIRKGFLDYIAPLYFMLMVALDPLPVGYKFSNGFFAIVFLIFGFSILNGKTVPRLGMITLLFSLTIVGHLIPILIGTAVVLDLATAGVIQSSMLLFFLFFLTCFFHGRRDRAVLALLAITAGFVPHYVIGHLVQHRELAGRAIALYQNPNAAGMTSVIVLFAARMIWANWPTKVKPRLLLIWLLIASGSAMHLALASQSRKSVLVIALLGLIDSAYFFMRSRNKLRVSILLAGILAAIAAMVYLAPEHSVLDRFKTTWRTFTDPTVTASEADTGMLTRLELLEVGLEIVGENPIIGQGTGAFRTLVSQQSNQVNYEQHSHNTFIDMYVEGGLLAFLAYSFIFLALTYGAWKWREQDGVYLLVIAFILISAGLEMGSWRYMDKLKWLVFAIIYGLQNSSSYSFKSVNAT